MPITLARTYAFQSIMNNILFITVHKGIIYPKQQYIYMLYYHADFTLKEWGGEL
jgi:hypothetical protein